MHSACILVCLRLTINNINLSTKLFCLALGVYEGMLWKKGKDNGQFLERKFVLSVCDFTLKYYKEDVRKDFLLSNEVCAPFRNDFFFFFIEGICCKTQHRLRITL